MTGSQIRSITLIILLLLTGCTPAGKHVEATDMPEFTAEEGLKLYWFIPDGMRADPALFDIYAWAKEGKLPNIKRMMERGSYGFSIPNFPSHTPVNFATLLTGVTPDTHGVADGPMHVEGRPLDRVSVGGFSSVAKKVEPIWVTLEDEGKDVFLLSLPGSTPPELEQGTTVRGRWGGWGADFHATNFDEQNPLQFQQGRMARLFTFGPPLQRYLSVEGASGWSEARESFSPAREASLSHYGETLFAYIYDSTDDGEQNYDRVAFSFDREKILTDLPQGEWSDWHPITLQWSGVTGSLPVETQFKIRIIKLDADGFFRIRLFYNNLNEYLTKPAEVAGDLVNNVGPMVDFVDNFPPQLIYYDEDKDVFLEELEMSFDWHGRATEHILSTYDPDIYIQDIYSPNQMLTSRWWMGFIDPDSSRYGDKSEEERERLWQEVQDMYLKLDGILGEMLESADENTFVVLSSDHGAHPLDRWVHLNNLFVEKGWLILDFDEVTGEPIIDWDASKVIYLKMDNVYINPEGLGGDYHRTSGEAYQSLRDEVRSTLLALEDPYSGIKPVVQVTDWEDASFLDLPHDRVGDLIIVNEAGYGWNEEPTVGGEFFSTPLKTGYKQAILPDETQAMWTPFIIVGPGIREGHLIAEPIRHQDQYPTLMHLLDVQGPHEVDGRMLEEILIKKTNP